MRLLGQIGSFYKVSFSHAAGFSPLSLAVPSKVWMAAARCPARSEPTNNPFFLLCKALHNKNYAQSVIMLSKYRKSAAHLAFHAAGFR